MTASSPCCFTVLTRHSASSLISPCASCISLQDLGGCDTSLLLRAEKHGLVLVSRGVCVEMLDMGFWGMRNHVRDVKAHELSRCRLPAEKFRSGGLHVHSNGSCGWCCHRPGISSARDSQPHFLASIGSHNIST